MAKKRPTKKVNHEPFQTRNNGRGRFVAMWHDMLDSPAWLELSGNDIKLYLMFLRKYQAAYTDGELAKTNSDNLSMPRKGKDGPEGHWGYEGHWGMRQIDFDKSVDRLIEYGFIRVVVPQAHKRKATIFGFSEMWKHYGTDIFRITNKDRRPCNIKRSRLEE